MKLRTFSNLALAVLLLCLYPSLKTHAYLDPGTGSYILQVSAAVLFSALYGVKLFWKKIVYTVKGLTSRKEK